MILPPAVGYIGCRGLKRGLLQKCHLGVIHSKLLTFPGIGPRPCGKAWDMTLTTLITVNAALAAIVAYAVVLFHAHAVRHDRRHSRRHLGSLRAVETARDRDKIAA